MNSIKFNKTFFVKSIVNSVKLKEFFGMEVAFLGYSNSGKSSILNCITNNKKLARVSKLPGRTRTINFFSVLSDFRLLDFPGYGYSKIDHLTNTVLHKSLLFYLKNRKCLYGVVIISDIRVALKPLDSMILKALKYKLFPILLVLTKSDKVSRQKLAIKLLYINNILLKFNPNIVVCSFSKFKKSDIFFIQNQLYKWYKLYRCI
ncbi:Probable GTP-binding protein EngB [Buchnera aphidicola (Cinara kochiana kochiana)]|uniref:Probable GTP-binding protein EngB n=1 Tax=Buchnera aphidicola (Cinara kochiana kochiana) TaxID=2518976 RepID=A0A451D5P8_9GAMM|nr:ribosome biogenesis GTP-binding protein YihA/YsxC [Buchnera aphidicola]VFP81180.1 Probable GTP-binding protein EngB [Buchnera aphidicola (Cinara kochiana kochiana)]